MLDEGQFADLQFGIGADSGQIGYEPSVVASDRGPARWRPDAVIDNQSLTALIALGGVIAMCRDVLAGDVADEFLVAVLVAVEDQARLAAVRTRTKPLRAQEQPELKRHVEPR